MESPKGGAFVFLSFIYFVSAILTLIGPLLQGKFSGRKVYTTLEPLGDWYLAEGFSFPPVKIPHFNSFVLIRVSPEVLRQVKAISKV
jgi:hypothetical protein